MSSENPSKFKKQSKATTDALNVGTLYVTGTATISDIKATTATVTTANITTANITTANITTANINDYTLPAADGTSQQIMVTDGAGNMTFSDQDAAFQIASNTTGPAGVITAELDLTRYASGYVCTVASNEFATVQTITAGLYMGQRKRLYVIGSDQLTIQNAIVGTGSQIFTVTGADIGLTNGAATRQTWVELTWNDRLVPASWICSNPQT